MYSYFCVKQTSYMDLPLFFDQFKEQRLFGRYITNTHIEPVIEDLRQHFSISIQGESVQGKPVYGIKAGWGNTKVFIWSQMHGNESTTTKAVFDFLFFLKGKNTLAAQFRDYFTFFILPILNPDGAAAYTRENANSVDLNRDSVALTQPESKILRNAFEEFRPDFAYNMHDQRTIFGVGDKPLPATVSFLAPSYNDAREVNQNRQAAINLIAAMNETLQDFIPGQVGRFDDSFNINCIGDMFQSLGVPTVLFEAGHFQGDYEREITRKLIFFALLSGFLSIYENVLVVNKSEDYFNIPQNKIVFFDTMYKNVKINYENKEKITNFASQYKEVLFDNSVIFQAFIREIGNLEGFAGHTETDCRGVEFSDFEGNKMPKIDNKADFLIGNDRKFVNGQEI